MRSGTGLSLRRPAVQGSLKGFRFGFGFRWSFSFEVFVLVFVGGSLRLGLRLQRAGWFIVARCARAELRSSSVLHRRPPLPRLKEDDDEELDDSSTREAHRISGCAAVARAVARGSHFPSQDSRA